MHTFLVIHCFSDRETMVSPQDSRLLTGHQLGEQLVHFGNEFDLGSFQRNEIAR